MGGSSKKIVENSYDEKLCMLIFIRGSLWTVFKGSPVGRAWLQLHFTSQATHGHGDQKGLKAMVCKRLGFTPRESWVQPCYGASCKQTRLTCTQSAEGQGHHHGAECITEQVARSEFKGRRKGGHVQRWGRGPGRRHSVYTGTEAGRNQCGSENGNTSCSRSIKEAGGTWSKWQDAGIR